MKISLLMLGMLTAGAAIAQAPQSAPAPNAESVSSWTEQNVLVNPFSAKPLSAEQIQAELEAARLHTQLLEEQLKQTNISAEIRNVPLRTSVEASQAETAVKKEEANRAQIEQTLKQARNTQANAASGQPRQEPAPVASVSKKPVEQKPATKEPKKTNPSPTGPSKPADASKKPVPLQPTLVSVVTVGNRKSVVIDVQGASLVVPDGGMTPFGPVVVMDETSANIGGRTYAVHGATIARFVSSDVAPPEVEKEGSGTGFGASRPGVAPASKALPVPQPGAPARNQLPPLMLPPGVNVLPQPQ